MGGLRNLPAMRAELKASYDEVTPPFSFRVTIGPFMEEYQDDPVIGPLLDRVFRP